MDELFTIEELIAATGGYGENISAKFISSISIDSRTLSEGALYVAIKGDRFDGHDFVHKAVVNGAAAALISQSKARELAGLPLIIVPDALAGLVNVAQAARARSKAKIIAVTGSAGKTTTKNMIALILAKAGETHASIKSFNNHWGVPLMLASMPPSARFGVFEIGMNHGDEITPLSKLVRPHVVLVTNVGSAHIGNFEGPEGIARAKAEIIEGMEPNGEILVNADHDYLATFERVAGKHRNVVLSTFGFCKSADVKIFDYAPSGSGGRAKAMIEGVEFSIGLRVPGEHMISNAVGAFLVAQKAGVDIETGIKELAGFSATQGRGQVLKFGTGNKQITLVDESYNANPVSMQVALKVFAGMASGGGSKILVLGDMYELGDKTEKLHLGLVDNIGSSGVERLVLVGDKMATLADKFPAEIEVSRVKDVKQLKQSFVNCLDWGDLIMVKGSKGVGLSGYVTDIKRKFGQTDHS